jgi:MFS family permease
VTAVARAASEIPAAQRRTVVTLVGSQAFGALGTTIGVATASLLSKKLSGSEELAGLAQTAQVLGAAVASWLLARLMAARGRRAGLVAGYLLGAAGSALAVLAGAWGSMPVLLVGAVLLGSANSANYASRYAATDLAEPHARGRALSIVVWSTTIGAVVGPNLTGPSAQIARAIGIPELTGPFLLGGVGMLLAAVVVAVRLRPDPLLLARRVHRENQAAGVVATLPAGKVMAALRERPVILAAMAGLAAAHAVMVSVMVMTPLHMQHGGSTLKIIGIVISVHVLGMYAFAPLVGMASDRLGRVPVLAIGGTVLLVALVLCARSPMGTSEDIFGGLFLLGVGWSISTVAASTLIAEQAPIESRTQVQGAADLVMSLAAAVGGGASGVIVGTYGFSALAGYSSIFAFVVVIAAGYAGLLGRRTAPAA